MEAGFWRSSNPVTPEEVFAYWHEPWEMWWAEQPFTITPEYVSRWIERKFSPTGPSANAFRYITASPDYTIMGRIEMGEASLIAELRASGYWGSMAAEFSRTRPRSPRWASSTTRSSPNVRRRAIMPDWRAWPFEPRTPTPPTRLRAHGAGPVERAVRRPSRALLRVRGRRSAQS